MSDRKRKKKQYYIKCAKQHKSRHLVLDSGMKGFLVTCNKREKEAVRESYNLLNEYAEKIWGPEKLPGADDSTASGSDDDDDVSAALQKEVASLKQLNTPSERRFQQVQSGASNVLFIKTTVEDPYKLAHQMFTEVYESQTSIARYIMRLVPVGGTCKTHSIDNITALAKELIAPYFEVRNSPSFCILFKARNNASISKRDIHLEFGNIIRDMNPNSQVEYNSPDILINVDIVRNICCIGVIKDFFKFRKYNLQEVVSAKDGKQPGKNDQGEMKEASKVGKSADEMSEMKKPEVETSKMEKPGEETSKMEKQVEETSKMEKPAEETSKVEKPAEETSKMEKPAEETSKMEKPVEETNVVEKSPEETDKVEELTH